MTPSTWFLLGVLMAALLLAFLAVARALVARYLAEDREPPMRTACRRRINLQARAALRTATRVDDPPAPAPAAGLSPLPPGAGAERRVIPFPARQA